MKKFESIRDICIALNQEAHKQKFFEQSTDEIVDKANKFVETYAYENGLYSRTVQPLKWSFSVTDEKLFDDGLIELITDKNQGSCFGYVEVSESKITNPASRESIALADVTIDNIHAHEAWVAKLSQQIDEWKSELKKLHEHEKEDLAIKIKSLESLLENVKNNSKKVSKQLISEIDQQWNAFQSSLDKLKNSFNK
tara:strand:- start:431 stop:1018 length:588 start_codon:yes stop_codon:yes gene_type:complete